MVKLERITGGYEFTAPGLSIVATPDLGGIPNHAAEFSLWIEFFGRWHIDVDFLFNVSGGEIHRASNNDIHSGHASTCQRWPCVSDTDEIPF